MIEDRLKKALIKLETKKREKKRQLRESRISSKVSMDWEIATKNLQTIAKGVLGFWGFGVL